MHMSKVLTAANLAILISIVSFVVSVISLRTDRRSNLLSEIDLLTNLQSEWGNLKEQWQRANLTVYGPDDYNSLAGRELRSEFEGLIQELSSGRLSQHDAQAVAFPWSFAIREIVDYLASVASYVLMGQLSPENAYAIFGATVVRRSRVIRAILGDRKLRVGGSPSEKTVHFEGYQPARFTDSWAQGIDTDWLDQWMNSGQFTGRTERILCLFDILWAEAALRQDMYRHDLVEATDVKRRYGSGHRNRKRVKRVVRQLGGSWFLALRLQWHLTHAEVVPDLPESESFYRNRNEIPDYGDPTLRGDKIRRISLLVLGEWWPKK